MALTFSQLTDEVMFNAFAGDFNMRAQRFLNEAVNEIGRRVQFNKQYEIAPFDANGTVTTLSSFTRIEEVWLMPDTSSSAVDRTGTTPKFAGTGHGTTTPTTVSSTAAASIIAATATRRLAPVDRDSGISIVYRSGGPFSYVTENQPGDRPQVTVRLYPVTTSGVVGLVGRALPPLMSNSTDVSGLGGEWDDALICFARSRCFRAEDDFQAAQVWMAEFDAAVRQAARLKNPAQDGPVVTPGMEDDGARPISGGW